MKDSIAVIHHLARSGGTMISKCLGSMEKVALLSEVHPRVGAGEYNPVTQADGWLRVDVQAMLATRPRPFNLSWVECIKLIHGGVKEQGRDLLVRDWSHIDFNGVPMAQPTYTLTTADFLAKQFDLRQVFTVRHPIDQWLSTTKLAVMQENLDIEAYLRGYLKFAEFAVHGHCVKYEDFTANPEAACEAMCETLGLKYDPGFIDKWASYDKITGDVFGAGRASTDAEIRPLGRASVDAETQAAFDACEDYHKSLELLGYDQS